jgi:hypothetical protein
MDQQVYTGHKARNHHNKHGNTDLIRHNFANCGNNHVGERQNDSHCHTHAQTVKKRCSDGHGRAHTKHLHQHRVLRNQALHKLFFQIHKALLPSQPMAPATASAALTPVVTPLVETVAPVMASTLLPTAKVPSAALLPWN